MDFKLLTCNTNEYILDNVKTLVKLSWIGMVL